MIINKIAIVGGEVFDSLSFHVHYTLKKMGYQPKFFDLGTLLERKLPRKSFYHLLLASQTYEKSIFYRLIKKIIDFNPELVIVIYRIVPPYVIKSLKDNLNAKVIFWTGDPIINFERGYPLISDYDQFFVKDKNLEMVLREKLGLKVNYLPECFNPDFHYPPTNLEFGSLYDVSIIGTLYPYRAKILESLQNEFDIKIFGQIPTWMEKQWAHKHTKKYVTGELKSQIIYGSIINLNTLSYSDVNSANCRLFEIAGAGGFQICDEKEAIKELFTPEKEIVFFNNIKDLKDKIQYYLNHKAEAYQIAFSARERAMKEHTYELRIKKVFEILNE